MAALAAGYHSCLFDMTSFCRIPKSSMFADMPLDNRTVDQFAAHGRQAGPRKACQKRHRSSKRSIISSRAIVL
jgi:hypothetical protein